MRSYGSRLQAAVGPELNAWGVRFNPTGTRAYVTSNVSPVGAVKVIDTTTYTVINFINVGDGPRSLALTPSGRRLFVANSGATR